MVFAENFYDVIAKLLTTLFSKKRISVIYRSISLIVLGEPNVASSMENLSFVPEALAQKAVLQLHWFIIDISYQQHL
jgi:hypothetical protein